ncbi:MAG: hypothetical protein IPL79_07025 [Myxococcales bacterium]|nr:hypothetical protein [Myxococcales bacterium]
MRGGRQRCVQGSLCLGGPDGARTSPPAGDGCALYSRMAACANNSVSMHACKAAAAEPAHVCAATHEASTGCPFTTATAVSVSLGTCCSASVWDVAARARFRRWLIAGSAQAGAKHGN